MTTKVPKDSVPKVDSSLGLDTGPGLTKQEFTNDSDINVILARYERTGFGPNIPSVDPVYMDLSRVGDYRAYLDSVNALGEAFMSLPASVRKRFDNDPALLLDFVSDSKNRDEAIRLGLMVAPKAPPVVPSAVPSVVAPKA